MNRTVARLVAGTLLLALPAAARAELYRSRDRSGRTVVTNLGSEGASLPLRGGTLSVATPRGAAPAPIQVRWETPRRIDAARRARYLEHVSAAAARYLVSPRLLEAVISVESDFNHRAVSRKGAQGLMQLMPSTARELDVANPFDPSQNIDGGARYLRRLLDEFGQNLTLALAAYNAGPGAVRRAGGRVPGIAETRDYVRKVRSLLGGGGGVVVRGSGGRVRLTNLQPTQSSVRLLRDRRGRPLITNR